MPSLTTSSLHRIGLALQRLEVNTDAESWVGPALTTSATSLPPLVFRPASTPAAVKPAGWVTLTCAAPLAWVSTASRLIGRCGSLLDQHRSLRSLLDLLRPVGRGRRARRRGRTVATPRPRARRHRPGPAP